MKTCPEVDAQWTKDNLLDLNWLEQHISGCPVCQRVMSRMAEMFEEEDEEGEEID